MFEFIKIQNQEIDELCSFTPHYIIDTTSIQYIYLCKFTKKSRNNLFETDLHRFFIECL